MVNPLQPPKKKIKLKIIIMCVNQMVNALLLSKTNAGGAVQAVNDDVIPLNY